MYAALKYAASFHVDVEELKDVEVADAEDTRAVTSFQRIRCGKGNIFEQLLAPRLGDRLKKDRRRDTQLRYLEKGLVPSSGGSKERQQQPIEQKPQ